MNPAPAISDFVYSESYRLFYFVDGLYVSRITRITRTVNNKSYVSCDPIAVHPANNNVHFQCVWFVVALNEDITNVLTNDKYILLNPKGGSGEIEGVTLKSLCSIRFS